MVFGIFAWVYFVAAFVVIAVLAVVTLCVHLMIRGGWRARVLSAVMLAALVLLVRSVMPR